MPEKLHLTHREAAILMDAVFDPFMRRWQSDPDLASLVQNRQMLREFMLDMARVLGDLLHGEGEPLTHLQHLCRQAGEAGLPLERIEQYAMAFLETFRRWVDAASDSDLPDARERIVERIEQLRQGQVHCEPEHPPDEGFLLADSDHGDSQIDAAHNITAGREAVSARDFLAQGLLDEDTIARIVDDVNELSSELYFYDHLNADYVDFVLNHLNEVSLAVDNLMEFDDLSWAIRQFSFLLDQVQDMELDGEKSAMVKQLTDQFVDDLVGWVSHVFVDQDAEDIHYLDAALLAAVKQIALMLGFELEGRESAGGAEANDDDDFVMF